MVRPRPGIEHRRRGLVGEQLGRGLQRLEQALVHGPQQEGGAADPVGQGRAIEPDALPGVDLRLPIERQVVGIFGHEHLGDGGVGRQPALDQPRRRRRLHHHLLAGAAGVFGPAHHQDPELGRHDVEALGDVLADAVQGAGAARAGRALDIDDGLDPRQVRRQGAAVAGGVARRGPARRSGSMASLCA